jgi:DNA-binding MarR family transcriptional regulator
VSRAGAKQTPAKRLARQGSLAPGESPGFLLWRVTLRWQRVMGATLRPLGLTHVQFVLLASAWWLTHVAGEQPSQRRLAEHASTDPMMTSQVLRALEQRRLITRAADPDDSRALRLTVTEPGARLALKAIQRVEAADAEFFAPAGETAPVLRLLRLLAG